MAIKQDKAKGEFLFQCDFCDAKLRIPGKTFKETWEKAKARGWRAFKDEQAEVWKHKCGDWRTHKANEANDDEKPEEVPF